MANIKKVFFCQYTWCYTTFIYNVIKTVNSELNPGIVTAIYEEKSLK